MMRVYLDNAASTPMDSEVLDQMIPYLTEYFGNPSSVHFHGRQLKSAIEKSRKTIAGLIGASPAEVFFTSGGTEADNMAIKCTVDSLGIQHIITTRIEHHAITHCVEEMEKAGKVKVSWLSVDNCGRANLEELEKLLITNPRTLVTLMHSNNELGSLNDVNAIGEICMKYDAVFHSDTVQSMGNIKYNFSETPIHMLSASAHKFYGPKGIGFLYMKSGTGISAMMHGGSQERNLRAGTENVAGIVGMAFALEKCVLNLEAKKRKLWELKSYLKSKLKSEISGIGFNGAQGENDSLPTVLNVSFPSTEIESMILFNLDIQGISASGGSACTSGSVKGSHVLIGIGCSPEKAANSVRFSFGIQNTKEELDYTVLKISEFMKTFA